MIHAFGAGPSTGQLSWLQRRRERFHKILSLADREEIEILSSSLVLFEASFIEPHEKRKSVMALPGNNHCIFTKPGGMGSKYENEEEEKMKCYYCGGKMAKGKTTYSVNKKGYHLLVDDIPAWICSQCREVYFEGDAVDIIQNVIKNIDIGVAKLKEEITA